MDGWIPQCSVAEVETSSPAVEAWNLWKLLKGTEKGERTFDSNSPKP